MGVTREEFRLIIKGLKAVYSEQTFIPTQAAFDIWYDSLKDLSYLELSYAAQKYIQTGHFSPKPADLREIVSTAKTPVRDYGSAWHETISAIAHYGYMNEHDALESMDPLTRKTVERIGYQNLCMSESPETDRANFRMIYETLAKREREEVQIAPALKQQMDNIRIAANSQVLLEG